MIITIGIIIYLLFTHFIADFVMQTNKMAQNKSSSNYWLSMHVLSYGLTSLSLYISGMALIIISAILIFNTNNILNLSLLIGSSLIIDIVLFSIINMGLHWITDYFTSRKSKSLYKAGKNHEFFIVVGLDQLIHQATLLATFYLLFIS